MAHVPLLALAARLRAGPTAFAAWCGTKDPAIVDGLLREGFDCAVLDWQHGHLDQAAISAGILAAEANGKAALVRIGVGAFAEAARYLDWGAAGIIAPMVNSVEDARLLAEFVKYPPLGRRSWGPVRALPMSGQLPLDHLRGANAATLAIAMIETREALDALDAILAVEGIDGVFVGPSDLSITLTRGALVDPVHAEVDAALTRVVAASRAAGKLACAFCMDGARAAELAARGFHLLSIGTDQILLRAAGRSELARARTGLPAGGKAAS
ncbi:HpcH/HpaI aldolase family protein [Rhabdaerophilum calidifontis]|uniref:HpcH/HpaI aldolase family protein n=1 Tax=Rhabdaerophilum calidifontis TaxID=2604328 RepID=UPI00123C35F9|nr:aldolase/citrate lyase family protein [Rhabdaerophilum calidifontis]